VLPWARHAVLSALVPVGAAGRSREGSVSERRWKREGELGNSRCIPVASCECSYWIPGSSVTNNSMSAPSNALPRLRTLCINAKKPTKQIKFTIDSHYLNVVLIISSLANLPLLKKCQMAEEVRVEAGIGESVSSAGTAVKTGIVGSLQGINEIETEVVNLVRNTVSNTVQATGSLVRETVTVVSDVVKGTIQATESVGTGLITSTKNIT
jgi:hypothetical protein